MFLTKEAARLSLTGVATGVACDGCPPLADLVGRHARAGGRYLVCPICFDSRKLDRSQLLTNADLGGTVQMWQWIGDEAAPPSATDNTLGHSSITLTSDTYTSVLPEVAREAAEAAARPIPRQHPPRTAGLAPGSHGAIASTVGARKDRRKDAKPQVRVAL